MFETVRSFVDRFGLAITACFAALLCLNFLGDLPLLLVFAGTALFIGALAYGAARPARAQTHELQRPGIKHRKKSEGLRIETLIDAWPEPAILLDENQIIRSINHAASELLEFPRTGDPISFRLRDPGILRAIGRALNDGTGDSQTLIEKIPTERRIRYNIQPFDRPGARYALVVLNDESATYRLERIRSDFVANASHELRTPLASVIGCIETLQGPARNDGQANERFLAIMAQQAKRMSAIIDDLLSLNRIEMQAHRRPTETVDLAAVVKRSIDLIRPDAKKASLSIKLTENASAATVKGDEAELQQVTLNLLENAVKYGASGDRVDIELADALEGGVRMVEFRVKDYGDGIKREDLPRLTERFYRAQEQTNPQATGTGLGLAIVKHIVARHRGSMLISSEPGDGATFIVRIPFQLDAGSVRDVPKIPERNQG
ncbi:MAG: ATP-binding protein [Pseudomonadota bacterium]